MADALEKKLVITVASSALFDLGEANRIFREHGEAAYRAYQKKHLNAPFEKGVAFPFVERLLRLNSIFPDIKPVEVILLSKNDPETGLRAFRSIKKYKLNISRAAFLTGRSPFPYLPAFNSSIFLSANHSDVRDAIQAGHAAGTVLKSRVHENDDSNEFRVAFDFDGVIANDDAEKVYRQSNDIKKFHSSEKRNRNLPLPPGPLKDLFSKISFFQKLELNRQKKDQSYKRIIRTAIITARNAPSHERVVNTLRKWGLSADETFFMGGFDKSRVLKVLKPHIYFDDQLTHLEKAALTVPSVHIPYGIANIIGKPLSKK